MPDMPSGSSTRMTPNAVTPASNEDGGDRRGAGRAARRRPGRGHRLGVGRRGRGRAPDRARGSALVQALQLGARLDADLLHQRRSAPRGTPRAPPTAGRSGTARACAGRAGARAAGAAATSVSSSPITSACRPPRDRRRSRTRLARSRSASSRRISAAANGSSATSASALAAPQRERLARAGLVEQALEAHRVDVVIRELQLVAAAAGDDPGAVAVEHPPQMRHVELHHLRRARRRLLAPQPSASRSTDTVRPDLEREHREHRPLLAGAQLDRPVPEANLERP